MGLTSIDSGDSAFNNDDWQSIETCQEVDNLLQCRQLSYHVQENCNQCTRAEKQSRNRSMSLPRPLRQDEALRTFPSDDRSQRAKDQKWQRRRQRIHQKSLDTSNRGDLRIGEQDTGSKCYSLKTLGQQSYNLEGRCKGKVAAARSSRKHYLDRVLTVLLSFTSASQPASASRPQCSRTESPLS
jgi:type IV secretory pathway VirB10-like protein